VSAAPARVFVALALPAERAAALAAAAAETLPAAAFRLARADGLHLTLVFLGDVARPRLAELARALEEAAAPLAPPELELAATGAFPAARAARVLWAGVRERVPGRLAAARAGVLAACARVGLAPPASEEARFHPHVTLARPRRPETAAPAAFLALAPTGPFVAEAAVLFESTRGAGAQHYLPLARAGFRGIS